MKEYLELFKEKFDTTVEDKCSPSNKPYVAYSPVSGVAYTTPDKAQAVDLGLSVKWASCNIGATFPEDTGDYFAWGEVDTKDYFAETYKWGDVYSTGEATKYNVEDGLVQLLPEDDAAQQNWGGKWRIPTYEECRELVENCTYEYCSLNGVKGCKFISKINSNWIFFPQTGFIEMDEVDLGYSSNYWSSSRMSIKGYEQMSVQFGFSLGIPIWEDQIPTDEPSYGFMACRSDGNNIRPVCP